MKRALFLIGSARRGGNTETLARRAAASLLPDTQQHWIHLDDVPLPPFVDRRHEPGTSGSYPAPVGNEAVLLEETLLATDIVFVAPLYWYSVPASTKLYLDYWSAWMRVPGREFRARMAGKTAWAVSVFSDEDTSQVEPLLHTLRLSAAYLGMTWGGSLLGYGSRPGDVLNDHAALASADRFFEPA